MDLRNLELFLHLAETLHFARTADAMAVSPSTLSRAIQRLEQEVGCPLLERDNRTAALTPAGIRVRDFAAHLLDEWQQLRVELKHADEPLQGRLKVYCSVTASYFLLPDILGNVQSRYPQLEIKLETGDAALAMEKVLTEEADMAIAARPDALPGKLHFISLRKVPLVFIAPRSPAAGARWLQEELDWSQIPVILSGHGVARKRADQWFRNRGISPNIYAEVAGNEAIVSMVALGFGVGQVLEAVLDHSSMRDKVRILEVHPAMKPFDVGLCLQKRRLDEPLIRAFLELAQQHS